MNFKPLIKFGILGLMISAVVGCSMSYNVAGRFESTGQPFIGTVVVSLGDIGTIDVATIDGSVVCSGESRVTDRPSSYTLIGAKGTGIAECNDGRTFKVDFIQTTDTGGHGIGLDSQSNIVKLYFDTSETSAQSRMELDILNTLVQ